MIQHSYSYGYKENRGSNGHMHPSVHCSTAYHTQDMEATQMFMERFMDKEDVVHTYNGTLLSHEKRKKQCHLQQHGWTCRLSYEVK